MPFFFFFEDKKAKFESLLKMVAESIQHDVDTNDIYHNVSSDNFWKVFEKDVADKLNELKNAVGEPDWEIIYQGGHKFPDIAVKIAEGVTWGVEIKTISSKERSWTITGGSIMESTSDKEISNIYVFCAKKDPFEIKYRKFEKCVKTVAITHSPRYMLDLELEDGETIFEKVDPAISYEQVRNLPNPFSAFRDYLTKENEGKETWWNYTSKFVNDQDQLEAEFVKEVEEKQIKFWSDLSTEDKEEYSAKMMVLFPEIIAPRCSYKNAAIWLFKNSIINPSFRDDFSAGGITQFEGVGISKKIYRIHVRRQLIIDFIKSYNKSDANADKVLLQSRYSNAKSAHDVWNSWKLQISLITGFTPAEKKKMLEIVESIGEEV